MVVLVSLIFLWIELAVLVLLAGILAVITAFGAMGANNLVAMLYLIALSVVCLALVATADIAFRRVRGGGAEAPVFGLRVGIAVGGAVIATGLTIYGRLFLSDNQRWVQGLDFLALGCYLWIPLSHLAALAIADRTAKRRVS
jgi:NADH:ubiquinone oxidoreductase subunit K